MSEIQLQNPRNIVSPRAGKQHDSTAPIRKGDPGYEEALCEVVECVKMGEMGHWPEEHLAKGNPSELGGAMPVLLRKELNIYGPNAARNLALAVSMDDYWDLGVILLRELRSRGVEWNTEKPGTIQFCDTDSSHMVFMKDLITRISMSMDKTFDIKYFWEKERPEDALGVHGSIFAIDKIGAPGHWAYYAGHATAAATTSNVLHDHLKLEGDLSQQVLHESHMFGFGRSILGVHWLEDNIKGFESGLQF